MHESLAQHRLELARELVDDIELSRLAPEQLLLKAARLGRLVDDRQIQEWLGWELNGYPNSAEARTWMRRFGRFTDEKKSLGYWMPLAAVAGTVASMQLQLQELKVPDINFAPSTANPNEYVTGFGGVTAEKITAPAKLVLARLQGLTTAVTALTGIRSRVLSAIHSFAVGIHYELAFSGLAESIFEKHRTMIDTVLAERAPEVLEKIPSIYDRLSEGDKEAVSQALNSVRRMIKALADHVYPPSDDERVVGGETYQLGSDKVLNRIKLYLVDECDSGSRRDRLVKTLRSVHERCSAGTHGDVTPQEAQALFLQAYLVLGEILLVTPSGS